MTQPAPNPIGAAIGAALTVPAKVAGAVVQKVPGVIPGADAAASAIDAVVATRRWIGDRHNWWRVVWGVSGVALVYIGVVILVRKPLGRAASATAGAVESGGSTIAKGATTAITKGK